MQDPDPSLWHAALETPAHRITTGASPPPPFVGKIPPIHCRNITPHWNLHDLLLSLQSPAQLCYAVFKPWSKANNQGASLGIEKIHSNEGKSTHK
ncbi:unnamed protein product [Victoria cruziana]